MICINVWQSIKMWPCVHQVYIWFKFGLRQNIRQKKQGGGGLWKMYTFLLFFKCIAALLCVFRCAVFFVENLIQLSLLEPS